MMKGLILILGLVQAVVGGTGSDRNEITINWDFSFTGYTGFKTYIGFEDIVTWTWTDICYQGDLLENLANPTKKGTGMNLEAERFNQFDINRDPRFLFQSSGDAENVYPNTGVFSVNFTEDSANFNNEQTGVTNPGDISNPINCSENTLQLITKAQATVVELWPQFYPSLFAQVCDRNNPLDATLGVVCEIKYCPAWAKDLLSKSCSLNRASTIVLEERCPAGTYSETCGDPTKPRGRCLNSTDNCDFEYQYEILQSNQSCQSTANVCQNLTVCANGTFEENFDENSVARRTSDRVCTPWQFCDDSFCETVAPTTTTDRECKSRVLGPSQCPPDNYHDTFPPGDVSCPVCKNVSVCDTSANATRNSLNQYVLVEPTATTNRQCVDCSTSERFSAADVVMVIDTSDSYEKVGFGGNPGTFELMKAVLLKLVAGWPLPNEYWSDSESLLGEAGSKFAAMSFSNDAMVNFGFEFGYQRQEILTAISAMNHTGGGSNIGKALDLLYNELVAGASPDSTLLSPSWRNFSVPTVVIIITDAGHSDLALAQARLADIQRDFGQELSDGNLVLLPVGFGGTVRVNALQSLMTDTLQLQPSVMVPCPDLEVDYFDHSPNKRFYSIGTYTTQTSDLVTCATVCIANNAVCVGFNHRAGNNKCELKSIVPTASQLQDNSNFDFYGRTVFNCGLIDTTSILTADVLSIANATVAQLEQSDVVGQMLSKLLSSLSVVGPKCPDRQFLSSPCTSSTDRICKDLTECIVNAEFVSQHPTRTSDRLCQPLTTCFAAAGEYETMAPVRCYGYLTAGRSYDSSGVPDFCSNRSCATNTDCSTLTSPFFHYQSSAGTPTSDVRCSPQTPCLDGEFVLVAANATTDRQCDSCTQCESFEFELRSCNAGNTTSDGADGLDRACQNYTTCSLGGEYESFRGNVTSDRECKPITICDGVTQFMVTAATPTSNAQCGNVTTCDSNAEYQALEPTPTSNRQCVNLTTCVVAVEYETVGPTFTTDRNCSLMQVCDPIAEFQVSSPTTTSDRTCDVLSTCNTDPDVYVSLQPTPTSNRICSPISFCIRGQEFESEPPTLTSDRNCTSITPCDPPQYRVDVATETSNTVCDECSTCGPGKFETSPCANQLNRVCQNFTACELWQYVSVPGNITSDQTCSNVSSCDSTTEFESTPATSTLDKVCSPISNCLPNQWEVLAPSPTSNAVCKNVTECEPNQYEFTAPTCLLASASITCSTCLAGGGGGGVPLVDGKCKAWCSNQGYCGTGSAYKTPGSLDCRTACTPLVADRVCANVTECVVDDEWEVTAPDATTDRNCSAFKICVAEVEFESSKPTPTVDRECAPLTTCSDFQVCAEEGQACRCDGVSRFVAGVTKEYTYAESIGLSQFMCSAQAHTSSPFIGTPITIESPTDRCSARRVPHVLLGPTCFKSFRCTNDSVSEVFRLGVTNTNDQPGPWGDYLNSTGPNSSCSCMSSSCEDCTRDGFGEVCHRHRGGVCPSENSDSFCDSLLTSECCHANTAYRNWTQFNCETLCCNVDCATLAPFAAVPDAGQCECNTLATYLHTPGSLTTNNDCRSVTKCNSTSFETAAPTATSDRECSPCTPCTDDEYASVYCSGTTRHDNVCNSSTVCANKYYTSVAATVSSDRECALGQLCLEGQFIAQDLTPSTDRVCEWINKTCDCVTKYESSTATLTSDASCSDMTVCTDGIAFETVPPSCSSNRECSECAPNDPICDGYTLDVIVVFDESESIENPAFGGVPGQFSQMLNLTAQLVKRLAVRAEGSHLSIVRYGSTASLELALNDYFDEASVISKLQELQSVSLTRGVTQPYTAVKLIREQLLHTSDPANSTFAGFRGYSNDRGSQVAIVFIGDDQSSTGQLATQVRLLEEELTLLDSRVTRYVVGVGSKSSTAYQAMVGAGNDQNIVVGTSISSIDGSNDIAAEFLCPSFCPFSQFMESDCTNMTDAVCEEVTPCDWVTELESVAPTLTTNRNCSRRDNVWPTEPGYCAGSALTLDPDGDLYHHECQNHCDAHRQCHSFVRRHVEERAPCFLNLNSGTCCRSIATVSGWISGLSPNCTDHCDQLEQASVSLWTEFDQKRCTDVSFDVSVEVQDSFESLAEICKTACQSNASCQAVAVSQTSLNSCQFCDTSIATPYFNFRTFVLFERLSLPPDNCPNNTYETVGPDGGDQHCALYTPSCCDTELSVAEPTSTSNRICITVCPDLEYEVQPANATSDAVCLPLAQCLAWEYQVAPPSITSNRDCGNATICVASTEFEAVAMTPTTDRNCSSLLECGVVGVEIETTAPTATSDRACEKAIDCVVNGSTFESTPATQFDHPVCDNITACDTSQYLFEGFSRTANNDCRAITACHPLAEYEMAGPTSTSDRDCEDLSVCIVSDSNWTITAATPTSDRVCEQRTSNLDHFTSPTSFPLEAITREKIVTLYNLDATTCALKCMQRSEVCVSFVHSERFSTCVLLGHFETAEAETSTYGFQYYEWKAGECGNTSSVSVVLDPTFSQAITGSPFFSNLEMRSSWTVYRCASVQTCHDDCLLSSRCLFFEHSTTLGLCLLWSGSPVQAPSTVNPYNFVYYNKVQRVTTFPTASPTALPTTLPSAFPTTSVPTSMPTHSLPLLCPTNCASPTSCKVRAKDNQIVCTACPPNKLLAAGTCVKRLYCKARKVTSGRLTGEKCSCLQKHCHYCKREPTYDDCRRCRDGWYMLNGTCVLSCPTELTNAGVGLWGRRCMKPHVCLGQRVLADVVSNCKCAPAAGFAKANCHSCLFEAGGVGDICLRCNNKKYLNGSVCIDSCAAVPGKIAYTPGSYGRECRESFTCSGLADEAGIACKCPNTVGGSRCLICDWNSAGATCTRCQFNTYLYNGKCVKKCRNKKIPIGITDQGRYCQ